MEHMDCLPPGFRFFPTDEELVTFYLARKAMDASFTSSAIRDVDIYKSEPWDLPRKAAAMTTTGRQGGGGDEECYFFCKRGSRYPSGVRAHRATAAGYWKSTGKDKGVRRGSGGGGSLVGTKKTLVFYRGRAPRGEKTSWVMHEYTLLGQRSSSSSVCSNSQRGPHREWVICRVFMKKPPSDHTTTLERNLEQGETVHGQTSRGHLRPMATSGGRDGEEAPPPPVLSNGPWHTDSRAADGDHEKDDDMAHQEELYSLIMNCSSCASPSWLLYDEDQLGPYCSTLHIL